MCGGTAGPGSSPRAWPLNRLLRLRSALRWPMLAQSDSELGWPCGGPKPSRKFSWPFPLNPLRPHGTPSSLSPPNPGTRVQAQVDEAWEPVSQAHRSLMLPTPLPQPFPQVLTGAGWAGAGQPAVDSTEDSGREWLVRLEGGAGHPESQLVRPSEESEPRTPPVTWAVRG